MAFFPSAGGSTADIQDKLNTSRIKNAAAFQTYVSARTAAGEKVDPTELYRVKLSLTGGDPGAASLIPAGAALDELTKQANQASESSRQTLSMGIAQSAKQRQDFIQGIIDTNWDKSPEEFNDIFSSTFGPDVGNQFIQQYRPVLPNMINEAASKKYSEIAGSEAGKLVFSADDGLKYWPSQMKNPGFRSLVQRLANENSSAKAESVRVATMQAINSTPDSISLAPPEKQREYFRLVAPAGQADKMAAGYSAVQVGAETSRIAKLANQALTDDRTSAWVNSAQSDAELTDIAKALLATEGITATGDSDPRLLALKGHLRSSDTANDTIRYEEALTKAKLAATEAVSQEEKVNQSSYAQAKAAELVQSSGIPTKSQKQAIDTVVSATEAIFGKDGTGGSIHASRPNMNAWFNHLQSGGFSSSSPNAVSYIDSFVASNQGVLDTKQSVINSRAASVVETTLGPQPQPAANYIQSKTSSVSEMTKQIDEMSAAINAGAGTDYEKQQKKNAMIREAIKDLSETQASLRATFQDPIRVRNLRDYDPRMAEAMMTSISDTISKLRKSQTSDPGTEAAISPSNPANAQEMAQRLVQARVQEEQLRLQYQQETISTVDALISQAAVMSRQGYPPDINKQVIDTMTNQAAQELSNKYGTPVEEVQRLMSFIKNDPRFRRALQQQ